MAIAACELLHFRQHLFGDRFYVRKIPASSAPRRARTSSVRHDRGSPCVVFFRKRLARDLVADLDQVTDDRLVSDDLRVIGVSSKNEAVRRSVRLSTIFRLSSRECPSFFSSSLISTGSIRSLSRKGRIIALKIRRCLGE